MFLKILFIATFLTNLASAFYPKESFYNEDSTALKWGIASRNFDKIVWWQRETSENFLNEFLSSESSHSLSTKCRKTLQFLISGLSQRKLWTYEFIDSFPRGDISYSRGNVGDLGKSDACINVRVEENGTSPTADFTGKYCIVNVNFPLPKIQPMKHDPMESLHLNVSIANLNDTIYEYYANRLEYFYRRNFYFGICVPSSCSTNDTETILNHASNGTELAVSLTKYCDSYETRETEKVPFVSQISLWIIIALVVIVILSTILEPVLREKGFKNGFTSFLYHFNASNSNKKLTRMPSSELQKRMLPMETFTTIAQMIAVAAHMIAFGKMFPILSPPLIEYVDHLGFGPVFKLIGFYSANSSQMFFSMAGFFNCYIVYPMILNSDRKIPFHLFLLKRYMRTIPTLVFIILFTFSTGTFVSHPAVREVTSKLHENCETGWWKTLLMINNHEPKLTDVCVTLSWFLSTDFQLWALSYVPLYFIVKSPKIGIMITILYIFIGCLSTTIVTYLYDLPSFVTGREFDLATLMIHTEKSVPWCRAIYTGLLPYFFGFLISYHLITKKSAVVFSRDWFTTNILLLSAMVGIFYVPFWWTSNEWPAERWVELVYSFFFKVPLTLFCAFFMINFYYGLQYHIPFLMTLFVNKFWIIAGRLTFGLYLSHMPCLILLYSIMFEIRFPHSPTAILGTVIILELCTFLFSYFTYLIVEAPFASIVSSLVKSKIGNLEKVENGSTEIKKND